MGGISYLWLGIGLYALGVLIFLARDTISLLKDISGGLIRVRGASVNEEGMRRSVTAGMAIAVVLLSFFWPIYALLTVLKLAGLGPFVARQFLKVMARVGFEIESSDDSEE